jgi:CHAT domain-containing protein
MQLHAVGQGRFGLELSLDALLVPTADGPQAVAVLIAEIQGARHVEPFKARLVKTENPQPDSYLASALDWERQRSALTQPELDTGQALTEPDGHLGGVPFGVMYDASLSGQVDGTAFELEFLLSLVKPLRPKATAPDLMLVVTGQGEMDTGFGMWNTVRDQRKAADAPVPPSDPLTETKIPEPGVAVTAEKGKMRVKISPSRPPRSLFWAAPDPDEPGRTAVAYAKTGTIELRVNGDQEGNQQISGTLEATGHLAKGSRQQSRISADIAGRRLAGKLLDDVIPSVGLERFSGRWQDRGLGPIDIRQEGKQVKDPNGTIIGEANGPLLDLRVRNNPEGLDRGFLRAVADGSLVGLAWSEASAAASARLILALPEAPIGVQPDSAERFPTPTEGAEADALKYLGQDYARAGKHRDAVEVLSKAVEYYAQRTKAAKDPAEEEAYLIKQPLAILSLIESAFEASDYTHLVQGLERMLDYEEMSGQRRAAPRILRDEAQRYSEILASDQDTFGDLAEAFERGREALTAAGIGAGLEPSADGSALVVYAIAPGMPADRAGIAVGDLVLSVEGMPIADMALNDVIARLRGATETQVSLVVERAGARSELTLTRAPLIHVASDRIGPLSESMTGLRDLARSLQRQFADEAREVMGLAPADPPTTLGCPRRITAMAAPSAELSITYGRLRQTIEARLSSLGTVKAESIALTRRSLAENPQALDLLVRFVALLDEMTKAPEDPDVHARMMDLDREVDAFERDQGIGDLDADLLKLEGMLLGSLTALQTQLAHRAGMLEKKWASTSGESGLRADAPEIAETLRSLAERLDRWRSRLASDPGKIQALEAGQGFYEGNVALLARLGLPGEALAVSEAARARAFLDRLAGLTQEREQLDATSANPPPEQILDRLTKRFEPTEAPDLEEILELVQARGSTVLEYFATKDALLTWVVVPAAESDEKPAVHLHCMPVGKKELASSVKRFGKMMEDVNTSERDTKAALRDLYDLLIAPVADLLPRPGERSLVIVPHRDLLIVPFAALMRQDASDHDRHLVQDHALVYAPSLGVLKQVQDRARGRRNSGKPSVLAVVNPKFAADLVDDAGKPMKPLPQMEADMPEILRFYDPGGIRLIKGANATLKRVLAELPGRDVVLLATHAQAYPVPSKSYIAFSDRRLRIGDLEDRHLDARLAILAACQSGLGRARSDGVEGLGRTVITAGADALMSTLWEVPDQATMELLYGFHQAWLGDGSGMAESLRQAQLDLLRNYPDQVRMWAGFALTGGEP